MNNTTNFTDQLLSLSNATAGGVIFPEFVKIIYYITQGFLVIFGLSGNILVILSILYNAHLKHSPSNLFIANLAVADIFVLAISHTFILGLEIHNLSWPFGEFVCHGLFPFSDAFFGVSIWSIVAISYQRYRGICHTMSSPIPTWKVGFLLCFTWVFSIALITVPLWVFMDLRSNTCAAAWSRVIRITYWIAIDIFFYLLPLILIVYFYIRIRITLKRSTGFHREMTRTLSHSGIRDDITKRIRRNAKALRVLTPVVVVFFLTMLPITIFRLLSTFTSMGRSPYVNVILFGCMNICLANSATNPVIYNIVSPQFRSAFKQVLGMSKRQRRLSQSQAVTASEYLHANNKLIRESDSL